jgi:hypothetical protein
MPISTPNPVTLPISLVGSPAIVPYFNSSYTFTATLTTIGDLVVLMAFGGFSSSYYFTSVVTSGPGAVRSLTGVANNMTKCQGYLGTNLVLDFEIWAAIVTTPGASTTFTLTNAEGPTSGGDGYWLGEFGTGTASPSWTYVNGTPVDADPATTVIQFPSIASPAPGGLYCGYGGSGDEVASVVTPGYSYDNDGGDGGWIWNASSSTFEAPTATSYGSGTGTSAIGTMFYASEPGALILPGRQAVARAAFR